MGFVGDEIQLRNQRLDECALRGQVIHIDAPWHKTRHIISRHVVGIDLAAADKADGCEYPSYVLIVICES